MQKNWIKQDLEYFKKCETAYRIYLKKINTRSDERVVERYSQRTSRRDTHTRSKSPPVRKQLSGVKNTERRPLNDYQKFIKKESEKYRDKSPKSRMTLIASKWRNLESTDD